jgi:uncharacterized protein
LQIFVLSMIKTIQLQLKPEEIEQENIVTKLLAAACVCTPNEIKGYTILKKSLDARQKQAWFLIKYEVYINEAKPSQLFEPYTFKKVHQHSKKIIIIGAGPAGLFAALTCLQHGYKPIILERGKNVKERRRDLAQLNKYGLLNEESNYCYGEGGAGTYSDGKLYTRSTKRGDINTILQLLVQFGAPENILYDAHPHIGTNKLPHIIAAIRNYIIDCGGEVCFNEKMVDLVIENNTIKEIITNTGKTYNGEGYVLATGHSANDVFELLHNKNILVEAKPFALGVRIEHPQPIIDQVQYKKSERPNYLPPAAYSWVKQVNDNAVFSFCMCPGGIIAPAATKNQRLVVNGWSPSKRNNPYANSGIVVAVQPQHWQTLQKQYGALAALAWQDQIEAQVYKAGGGNFKAPANRLVDFCEGKTSTDLPECSYTPGTVAHNLKEVLPSFIIKTLQEGFKLVGQHMKGYYTNEAIIVATESRTSSPVRVPRDHERLQHPAIKNLYPCGEGAGYAGGIISAAIDGMKVAASVIANS